MLKFNSVEALRSAMIKGKPEYLGFFFYRALALKNIFCLMIEHYVKCNGSEGKEEGGGGSF